MTERKHTELPYKDDLGLIIDAAGYPVAKCYPGGRTELNDTERAEFIVHACNNHYALIERLEEIYAMLDISYGSVTVPSTTKAWEWEQKARATLKQAKGESDEG